MADYAVDAVVVGAGVVGLAVARALALRGLETLVLERASLIGSETSSRNSEVIHAGIYYPAGSAKARLCVAGRHLLYEYLQDNGIDHARCGKLIAATTAAEVAALDTIAARARQAGVHDLQTLTAAESEALEPRVQAVAGLLSPATGIVDSHQYMLQLQADIEANGGLVALNTALDRATWVDGKHELVLGCAAGTLSARYLVNAAGLAARTVLQSILGSGSVLPEQHFAIGHYYAYPGAAPFARLVYPTPVAGGLGVHATIDLAGQVRFGPDVRWLPTVDYRFDDSRREAFVAAIRRYFPGLDAARLQPGYTGIRPKLSRSAETDFTLLGPDQLGRPGLLSLHGIESPGLTASLAIANAVVERLFSRP
ncbi:MAG: NAD(P)/FAD-dependent oxidoreductase [Pseudomonadales bacterium]